MYSLQVNYMLNKVLIFIVNITLIQTSSKARRLLKKDGELLVKSWRALDKELASF